MEATMVSAYRFLSHLVHPCLDVGVRLSNRSHYVVLPTVAAEDCFLPGFFFGAIIKMVKKTTSPTTHRFQYLGIFAKSESGQPWLGISLGASQTSGTSISSNATAQLPRALKPMNLPGTIASQQRAAMMIGTTTTKVRPLICG